MKPTTGYVYYDKSRKKWVARVSYTEDSTGKRQSVRRWHPLKSDAIEALPDLLATLKTHGHRPLKGELFTMSDVIKAYEDEHVKPPEIHDGRKVAGLKSWVSVKHHCEVLKEYLGKHLLRDLGPSPLKGYKQAQFKEFLELKNGLPSHDTFGRVLALLEPREFEQCLGRWIKQKIQLAPGEVIAVDGKTLRGSHAQSRAPAQIESVSAWAQQQGVLLAEVKVAEDSNETAAVPQLLPLLNLAGCIVTFDALNCQKTIVEQIHAQQADYVGALKGNQAHLEQAVAEFLQAVRADRTSGIACARHETIEKDHGWIEARQYWQATAPDWLPEFSAWRDLQSVGCVIATRTLGEQTTTETCYYLSSLAVEAPRFATAVRGHWSIENSCHWILDVIFGEDASREIARESEKRRRLAKKQQ